MRVRDDQRTVADDETGSEELEGGRARTLERSHRHDRQLDARDRFLGLGTLRTKRRSGIQRKDRDQVLKVSVFLSDRANFAELNELYIQYFSEPYPARTTIQAQLPRADMLIEVDCIAAL